MKRLAIRLFLGILLAYALPLRAEDPAAPPPQDGAPSDSADVTRPAPVPPAPAPTPPPVPVPPVIPQWQFPEPPVPRVWDAKTVRFTGGALIAVPIAGYLTWWRNQEQFPFHFTNEGWFQRNTYAGGADKASHIALSFMATDLARSAYRSIGKTETEARWLSVGLVAASGAIVEIGDGVSHYGFSWEDLTADVIGGVLSDQVHRLGLGDTVGMRFGLVREFVPDPCCTYKDGYGADYSGEIFTIDARLAGLLPRMGVPPGPARFFLVSVTYDSKGYRYSLEDYRQRNIGLELGLNLPEILRAAGVREEKWWGNVLLTGLTYVRIPYTSFGYHYDLNHGRWSGPDTGDRFSPGP